jgi:hypothetical protein
MFEVDMGINLCWCWDPSITAYWYHLLLRIDQGFKLRHEKLKKNNRVGGGKEVMMDPSPIHSTKV